MKLFRKRIKKTTQDEKTLAEARELAANRLEQYMADRRTAPPTKDSLGPVKKSVSAITRLRWWW